MCSSNPHPDVTCQVKYNDINNITLDRLPELITIVKVAPDNTFTLSKQKIGEKVNVQQMFANYNKSAHGNFQCGHAIVVQYGKTDPFLVHEKLLLWLSFQTHLRNVPAGKLSSFVKELHFAAKDRNDVLVFELISNSANEKYTLSNISLLKYLLISYYNDFYFDEILHCLVKWTEPVVSGAYVYRQFFRVRTPMKLAQVTALATNAKLAQMATLEPIAESDWGLEGEILHTFDLKFNALKMGQLKSRGIANAIVYSALGIGKVEQTLPGMYLREFVTNLVL